MIKYTEGKMYYAVLNGKQRTFEVLEEGTGYRIGLYEIRWDDGVEEWVHSWDMNRWVTGEVMEFIDIIYQEEQGGISFVVRFSLDSEKEIGAQIMEAKHDALDHLLERGFVNVTEDDLKVMYSYKRGDNNVLNVSKNIKV